MIYIAIATLLVAIGIWKWRQVELRLFRATACKGELCVFRHKGLLVNGHIVSADEDTVVINSRYGSFKRLRTEIWPR